VNQSGFGGAVTKKLRPAPRKIPRKDFQREPRAADGQKILPFTNGGRAFREQREEASDVEGHGKFQIKSRGVPKDPEHSGEHKERKNTKKNHRVLYGKENRGIADPPKVWLKGAGEKREA